ncbi:hypothetical protein LZ198_00825 [Myxococcus sp. K15C18031901]|uniref:hypothetical protein n=1 Tax=Myxococcus dinghuensis TaxID=2906761 RepID=UPI0020A6E860|nr:hypothetical protein [Myxococcus dinghuensis]MCP3097409.1 hypothetical protein [Myxococcus dinghuensis]
MSPRFFPRRWVARAALLVACVASVASSNPGPDPLEATSSVQHLRLSSTSTRSRQVFVVGVVAPKHPEQTVTVGLGALLQARWVPDDARDTSSGVVRARMSLGRSQSTWRSSGPLVANAETPTELRTDLPQEQCSLREDCRVEAVLEVEWEGEPRPGVVEVDWVALGELGFEDGLDMPPDVTFTLGLP